MCLVYDSTNAQSFEALENYWVVLAKEKCDPDVVLFICANKCDYAEKEEVSMKEASAVAKKHGANLH